MYRTKTCSELHTDPTGQKVVLSGWVKSKRESKQIIFLDLCDSTGNIQLILEDTALGHELFNSAEKITIESAIKASGTIKINDLGYKEVQVNIFSIISLSTKHYTPELRNDFDIFDEKYIDQMLSNRRLYIRNRKKVPAYLSKISKYITIQ
ncbi:MAG: hypothetical protein LBD80_08820 [Tannerella sp.]|jgi:aspartyl/asparaginyl-tRNA synthetase|nr:hypothetical protein [Tannerella sp.]